MNDLEDGEERDIPARPEPRGPKRYVTRCGSMRTLCVLESRQEYPYATRVLCRTPRGVEVGEVLCEATAAAMTQLEDPPEGSIMRRLNDEDLKQLARLKESGTEDFDICQRNIESLNLQMQLVDIERIFGG